MERLTVSDWDIMRTFFPVSKKIPKTLAWGTLVSYYLSKFHKYYEYESFINDLLYERKRQSTVGDFFVP